MKKLGFFLHPLGMVLQGFARFFVNHRSDIDIKELRITDLKLLHRTDKHVTQLVGNVFLDKQNTQGRTTLPRRLETGNYGILNHLFWQGGRINDHRILTTGLRNQRQRNTRALRQGLIDQLCGFRRPGKGNTGNSRIIDQLVTNDTARPRNKMECRSRNACFKDQFGGTRGNQ